MKSKLLWYLIPVAPLIQVFKNENRRFFVFIEQPIIGFFITPVSIVFAGMLLGTKTVFDFNFFRNFLEVYLAYQTAQIIRDGINTDPSISKKQKVYLNWFYSATTYILFTAGDRLALATGLAQKAFAVSLVIFSLLWPILSQITSTHLWTPILFCHFPRKSLLKKLGDKNLSKKDVLASLEKDERESKGIIWWINWWKRKNGEVTVSTKTVYWITKTAVGSLIAILMTSLYFVLRWNFVGIDAGSPAIITRLVGNYALSFSAAH